jgi:hypothetical protein
MVSTPHTGAEITALNRSGEMTPGQRLAMERGLKAAYSNGLILAGLFTFLFGLILLVGAGSSSSSVDTGAVLLFGGLTAICVLAGGWQGLRLARALREVKTGRLEHGTGEVVWDQGNYRAAVEGRKLDLAGQHLGAGNYEFYFLPGSNRVVAAELLAADTPEQARELLLHALAVTNGFNVDWLPDFRTGRLGAGRQGRLRRTWSGTGWTLLLAVVILAAWAFVLNANPESRLLIPLAIGDIFLAIAVLIGVLSAIRPTLDILADKVGSEEGPAKKVVHETHGRYASTFYYYQIGSRLWSVTPVAYRAIVEGERYRIYYLPHVKELVGIEPISKDEG